MNPLLLLALASLNGAALGAKKSIISNVGNFYSFLEHVNSGADYSGSTVYLTKDLDFSSYPPLTTSIGFNMSTLFKGLFVADGYVISGLSINMTSNSKSSIYGGLFGFTYLATISGVVLDESCSVTCVDNGKESDIGGIIGYSQTSTIKDCVNMASLTFINRKSGIVAGGLIGMIGVSSTVINSVNYGPITVSGSESPYAYLGGIAGTSTWMSSCSITYIINCANLGHIAIDAQKVVVFYAGGIVAQVSPGIIHMEHCVNSGNITNKAKTTYSASVGCLIGQLDSVSCGKLSVLKENYWPYNLGLDTACGEIKTIANVNITSCRSVDFYSRYTLIAMNSLPTENNTYTYWMSINSYGGKFITGTSSMITTGKDFPKPKKEGYVFLHWCTDSALTKKYRPFTTEITNTTSLLPKYAEAVTAIFDFGNGTQVTQEVPYAFEYGRLPNSNKIGYTFNGWFTEKDGNGEEVTRYTNVSTKDIRTIYGYWTPNNYTVTFIFNNGDADEEREFVCGSDIVYPIDPVRDEYTFIGWEPKPDKMPGGNVTVEARWKSNNLTVTFDAGEIEVTQKTKVVMYNKLYGELPSVGERTGYTFAGWFTEKEEDQGERVTEETTVPTKSDHTLYAHWTVNSYSITFNFNNGGKNEERSFDYNETIVYPVNMTKEGHSFNGWSPKPERMPAENVIVTAQWRINSYAVTFVFGNGDADKVVVLEYGETIVYPENVVRKGYTFNGWSPKPETMGDKNIRVVAQWVKNSIPEHGSSSEITGKGVLVEVVLEENSITPEEAEELVRKYTTEKFTPVSFEVDMETGEIRVIIKFQDKKTAESFVENVNNNTGSGSFIKEAKIYSGKGSLAAALCPMMLAGLFVGLF